MPEIFLLHGLLGVGKMTFAKRLEKEENALRFSHNEWMSRLHGNDQSEALFPEHARGVFDTMGRTWTRCLEIGTNVVLDFGFRSRAEWVQTRCLATGHVGKPVCLTLRRRSNGPQPSS